MKELVITTEYFGPISSYRYMAESERIWIEKKETYQKKSYRNRCLINSPQGIHLLSVPLLKGKNSSTFISDVEIAYHEDWITDHVRAMEMGYNNTPFFEFYIDDIKEILDRKYNKLIDLNDELLKYMLSKLYIDSDILSDTVTYQKEYRPNIVDLRKFDYRKKERANVSSISYRQPFDDKYAFISELSILDLLFCVGPESTLYLEK